MVKIFAFFLFDISLLIANSADLEGCHLFANVPLIGF